MDFSGRNIWTGSDGAPVTSYKIDSDRRDLDISNRIAYLEESATPYLTILMKARKQTVNSKEFIWYDKGAITQYTTADGDYSDSDTTISLTDASHIKAKDLIKNTATGEIMFVEKKSTDDVDVQREVGYDSDTSWGTEAAEGSDGDYILRLGPAMEENSLSPATYAEQPVKLWNYVQTLREPFNAGMIATSEPKSAGGSERNRLRKEFMITHRIDIEKNAMFGERGEDVSNERTFMGGLLQYIRSKSYDVGSTNGGVLTEAEWENYCEEAFEYGSGTKLFLTSRKVGSILNQFAAGKIQTTTADETYGMRLHRYISFHGDVIIGTSELFKNDYANMGVMIDLKNIKYRPYQGYDSKLRANIQENDRLGWKDEYLTVASIETRKEKSHSIITGITK